MMTILQISQRWPLWQCKLKCLVFLTAVFLTVFFTQKLDVNFSSPNTSELEFPSVKYTLLRNHPDVPDQRIVHVDLKGAPPKIEYLLELISFVKNVGGTGILMEYEDMFPYRDDLEGISALNAYTRSDVARIEETARKNNISIIPLIPTFGHIEFVLKLEKFKKFREVPSDPETICPSRSGIYTVLLGMIDQVLEVHKQSEYVHIGCDEAEHLGICTKCRNNMRRNSLTRNDLFLRHIRKIGEYINNTHPGVRAIVWGNNVAKQTQLSLFRNKIPDLVDIMLSNYKVDLDSFPSMKETKAIAEVFPKLWVAGSYKGTAELFRIVPDIDLHLVNSRLWKQFIQEWKSEIFFKGIVLTGQQRYSHFEVLTELLPVSIPSLAINLQPFQEVQDFDYEILKQSLTCNDFLPLNPRQFNNLEQLDAMHCDFPGFEVYRAVFHFFKSTVLIKQLLQNPTAKYLSFYNILHGEGRPSYIRDFSVAEYETQLRRVKEVEGMINAAMIKFYDNYTVSEWITTYVIPVRMTLQLEITTLSSLVNTKVWPRRPLVNDVPHFNAIFNSMCPENDQVACSFALFPKFSI